MLRHDKQNQSSLLAGANRRATHGDSVINWSPEKPPVPSLPNADQMGHIALAFFPAHPVRGNVSRMKAPRMCHLFLFQNWETPEPNSNPTNLWSSFGQSNWLALEDIVTHCISDPELHSTSSLYVWHSWECSKNSSEVGPPRPYVLPATHLQINSVLGLGYPRWMLS